MTRVLALLRPLGPPALAWLRSHWEAVALAVLLLVAVLALRGYGAQKDRAEAGAAQVAATFKAELARALSAQEALAREVAKAQAAGARPVEVGQGSARAVVLAAPRAPAKPGARWDVATYAPGQQSEPPQPATAPVPSPAGAVPSPPPDAAPCVLAIGDEVETLVGEVNVREEDGTRVAYVGLTLKAFDPDRDVLTSVVRAPLAPAEVGGPTVEVEARRARWAVRGGVVSPLGDPGFYVGAGLRVLGGLWVEGEGRRYAGATSGAAGLRWELP